MNISKFTAAFFSSLLAIVSLLFLLSTNVSATISAQLSGVDDPLGDRFSSLGQIAGELLPFILLLGGMIALLFIIWGGFKYMTARGDPKAIDSARGTIVSAVIGLLILALIFVILSLIELVFKIKILANLFSPVYAQGINIGCAFKIGNNQCIKEVFPNFGVLITSIISFALAAAGLVFFAILIWGGMRYMTAQGDEKNVASAKQTITNAVIGLLIIVASFVIINLIAQITGADISIF